MVFVISYCEYPDEMSLFVVYHMGLHCVLLSMERNV